MPFLTYGLEYTILPLLTCPALYISQYYGMAGALFVGAVVTALNAGLALWRGETLRRQAIKGTVLLDRMDPVYPTFIGVGMMTFTVLQIILSVSHWSYFRDPRMLSMLGV
ncbi:hypothetical protein DIPPA_04084 [Diplonema papillatum]|nr:hypothetical protein DIPPA_04084 [Diplonema papillatum]